LTTYTRRGYARYFTEHDCAALPDAFAIDLPHGLTRWVEHCCGFPLPGTRVQTRCCCCCSTTTWIPEHLMTVDHLPPPRYYPLTTTTCSPPALPTYNDPPDHYYLLPPVIPSYATNLYHTVTVLLRLLHIPLHTVSSSRLPFCPRVFYAHALRGAQARAGVPRLTRATVRTSGCWLPLRAACLG